jgi:hypothetical protein
VSGFRVFAEVDVTSSFTREDAMGDRTDLGAYRRVVEAVAAPREPSVLAVAVGDLCRPGGLTEENRRRVEEAILAPRTVDRSAADAFHDHLDVCKQCRENPFSLCRVGLPLLTATMAKPAPRLSPEAERRQAIRLAREAYESAEARRRLADRETMEAELALRELDGREGETHTRYLRAYLAGDAEGVRAARNTAAAENFIKYGWRPSDDLNADEVTAEVCRLRAEREH